MVGLNLSLDDVRIVKKQLRLLKNAKKIQNVRRKESSIWRINKKFYLGNPKNLTSLEKYMRKWSK